MMIAAKGKYKMCLLQRGKMRNIVTCIVPGTKNRSYGGKKFCTTAGTQENITWGKHITHSVLQPIPFLTYWKNTKSSTAVVKEKHKLQLFLRKR